VKFIDSLQPTPEPWAQELLAHNLSTVFANRFAKQRYLLLSVSGEVRGFLSDHEELTFNLIPGENDEGCQPGLFGNLRSHPLVTGVWRK
jgi:hypothetical protein